MAPEVDQAAEYVGYHRVIAIRNQNGTDDRAQVPAVLCDQTRSSVVTFSAVASFFSASTAGPRSPLSIFAKVTR